MIYITVPVTSRNFLIEFLGNQLSDSMCNVLSSDLDDAVVESHKDLLFASQQALKQCEESQKCPG